MGYDDWKEAMIDRTHLEIIYLISEKGSLTEAAKALHLNQSTLSHSIRKIEQQFDVKIWKKQGRHIQFTQAGKYLVKFAQRVLPQFKNATSTLALYATGKKGLLQIGMECYPCYQWIIGVIDPFMKQYQDVDVDIKQHFQFGGIAALLNHDIDLLVTPDPFLHDQLEFKPAFDYELVLVTGKNALSLNKDYVDPHQLEDQSLISYPVPIDRLDIYNQFFTPANVQPNGHKTIESTELILQMVSNHRGVAALPKWLIERYQKDLSLDSYRLGKNGIHKSIHLGFRKEDFSIDYIADFLSIASQ